MRVEKNEVVESLVKALMDQRKSLVDEISMMNHNEVSWLDRKNTLEYAISNIDMKITDYLFNMEIYIGKD